MQIRIITSLLLLSSFAACRQEAEKATTSTAEAGFKSAAVSQMFSANMLPTEPASKIVFQSSDAGNSWQDVSAGLPVDYQGWSVFSGGGEVFLGDEHGVYRSGMGSTIPNWSKEFFLDGRVQDITPGRAGLYACSYGFGLFQNMPGTDMWKDLSKNLTDRLLRTVVETADGSIIIGTDKGLLKSSDGGQNWKQVYDGGMILDLVASNGILIAGGEKGVMRSGDGGEHWTCVLDKKILIKKAGLLNDRFVAILGTENAEEMNPEGITSRLLVSDDAGLTWHRMEQPLLPVSNVYDMDQRLADAKDIYDIVQVGNALFCSFDTGLFRSTDQGKTWEPVLVSPKDKVFSITVSGKVIYAIPRGGGC